MIGQELGTMLGLTLMQWSPQNTGIDTRTN